MAPLWYDALRSADPAAAAALAPHMQEPPADLPADTVSADAEATAVRWLSDQYPCPNVLVAAGGGQSDLLPPLLFRKQDLRILWVNRHPERLAAALNGIDSRDLAEAIQAGRLWVDPGESEETSINRFLGAADFSRVPRIRLLEARPLTDEEFQMATDMTRAARELIRFQAVDMSTRSRFGSAWQSQTVRNLPRIVTEPGIRSLFGQFQGTPALVIAAGPSLADAVPYIKAIRERIVIIAVGRVLNYLLRRAGIVPDLVVTGDGQSIVAKHFKNKPAGLPVAASCFTDPDLIDALDRVFFMEMMAMGMPAWLRSKIGARGEIYPGGNVSTAAMSVAVEMGCNPVYTAGLDFSYPDDGKTHVAARNPTGDKSMSGPNPVLYEVPGNYHPTVKTNRQMFHYIDFAKEYIADHSDVDFVNVNTAGARIDGTRLVRPEALGKSVTGPPVNAASRITRIYAGEIRAVDIAACVGALRADLAPLQSLRAQCMQAAMICNRMIMMMRRSSHDTTAEATVHNALAQLKPIDDRLKSDPVMDLIEARLERASQHLAERMMTPGERALPPPVRSYRRWREFYKGVADACQATEALLTQVIDELDGRHHLPAGLEINRERMEVCA